MAVPTLDAPLAQWSTNFNTRGVAAPADFQLTAAQMNDLKAGNLYVNVHTAKNKGGEVRGQIQP